MAQTKATTKATTNTPAARGEAALQGSEPAGKSGGGQGEPLLRVRDLTKVYEGGAQALAGVSMDIYQGEFLVCIGLSGSGKSTLIRCLNRLVEPSGGTIELEGRNITAAAGAELRAIRSQMAMIFQQFNLIDRGSVITNVLTGALHRYGTARSLLGLWHKRDRDEAMRYIELVGLADYAQQRVDTLSGGQQQRVAIARALMQHPRLILADEPVASLDPATSHSVMKYLKELQVSHQMTVVANLHFLSLVREYGTRVIALRHGKTVFEGLPSAITDETFREIYGDDAVEVEIR